MRVLSKSTKQVTTYQLFISHFSNICINAFEQVHVTSTTQIDPKRNPQRTVRMNSHFQMASSGTKDQTEQRLADLSGNKRPNTTITMSD